MARIADLVTRRWVAGLFALAALLSAGAVIGVVGQAEQPPSSTTALPLGSDSLAAAELRPGSRRRAGRPPSSSSRATGPSPPRTSRPSTPRRRPSRAPRGCPHSGARTAPPRSSSSRSSRRTPWGPPTRSRRSAEAARADLPDGLTAQVTGPAAIQADLAAVFDGADTRLLLATASIVALLLVLTYRSPVLWVVPLTVVGAADQLAAVLATRTLAVVDIPWDESTVGILSVLVFGAGTDYALLLISRYRDELRSTEDRRSAMAHALRRTAEAVLSSASTVVLGLLTLLLSLFPTTRGLGLACAVGVVVAAAFVLLVLPAALVVFGRWVFWPQVPRVGQQGLADGRSLWRRVGDTVARRPLVVVGGTLVVLAVAASAMTQIRAGLSTSDQFLDTPESITASQRYAESFPAGSVDPVVVMTTGDGEQVAATVGEVPGVESARVAASGGGVTEVDAVLAGDPGSEEVRDTVARRPGGARRHPGHPRRRDRGGGGRHRRRVGPRPGAGLPDHPRRSSSSPSGPCCARWPRR